MRRILILSITFISIVIMTVSCESDDLVSSPVGWHVATDSEWYEILETGPKATLIGVQWESFDYLI